MCVLTLDPKSFEQPPQVSKVAHAVFSGVATVRIISKVIDKRCHSRQLPGAIPHLVNTFGMF